MWTSSQEASDEQCPADTKYYYYNLPVVRSVTPAEPCTMLYLGEKNVTKEKKEKD